MGLISSVRDWVNGGEQSAATSQRVASAERGMRFLSALDRVRGYQGMASDFSGRANGRHRLDPAYGPMQMGTDLRYLREEAERIIYKFPHAKQANELLINWTLMTGINIIPKARNKTLQKKVMEVHKQHYFGFDAPCDSLGYGDYWTIEELAFRHYIVSGEVLVYAEARDFADGLPVPVSYKVIDPIMLYDGPRPKGVAEGNKYAAGVELDRRDRPVAYWLYKSDPRDTMVDRTPKRIPVKDRSGQTQIVHIFKKNSVGQIRGIPRVVSALATLYEMQDYKFAILRRKRLEAKIGMIFKESHSAQGTPHVSGLTDEDDEDGEGLQRWEDPEFLDWMMSRFTPDNAVMALPPGWDSDQFKIEQISDHKEFLADLYRTIAAAFDVPYNMLTMDLTQVSYSGAKIGGLGFKVARQKEQMFFINKFHGFCWSNFVTAGRRAMIWKEDTIDVTFRYDAFPSADPDKDAKVQEIRYAMGTLSHEEACAEWGVDAYEILEQNKQYDVAANAAGMVHFTTKEIAQRVSKSKAPPAEKPEKEASEDDSAQDSNTEEKENSEN